MLPLSNTHNPEGVVLDLSREALVFIDPPLDAVFTGVVWKDGLAWPHLPGRQISHEGALCQAPGDAGSAHQCMLGQQPMSQTSARHHDNGQHTAVCHQGD